MTLEWHGPDDSGGFRSICGKWHIANHVVGFSIYDLRGGFRYVEKMQPTLQAAMAEAERLDGLHADDAGAHGLFRYRRGTHQTQGA